MFHKPVDNLSLGSTSLRGSPNLSKTHLRSFSVIEQKGEYVLEQYGQPLPVQVKEYFQRGETTCSACVHPSGWCYLVTPTSFFLWRYPIGTIGSKHATKIEYPLPSTGQFTADSISLLPNSQKRDTFGAILAVSQTGEVRYWPSIGSDVTRYYDSSIKCTGTPVSCQSLSDTSVVIVCHESQVYRLSIDLQGHVLNLLATRLDTGGILAGIGKRMSSLFFRSGTGADDKIYRQLTQLTGTDGHNYLFILTSTSLQKWTCTPSTAPVLVYDSELVLYLREQSARALWPYHSELEELISSLQLVLLDCCPFRGSLAVLLTASQSDQSSLPLASYLLALINPQLDSLPDHLDIHTANYSTPLDSDTSILLTNRLLASDVTCCISNPNYLAVWEPPAHTVYNFDFSPTSTIIGYGTTPEDCIAFFSRTHGVVRLSSTPLSFGAQLPIDMPNPSLTTHTVTPSVPMNTELSTLVPRPSSRYSNMRTQRPEVLDLVRQLEKAMFSYIEGNQMQACIQVDEALPSGAPLHIPQIDSLADVGVLEVSRIIVNDKPASDPRWLQQIEEDPSGSLIIQQQMQHKLVAHETFVSFIRETGLMGRLGLVTYQDKVMPTCAVLSSHSEKLVACLILRRLHTRSTRDLLSGAIKLSLQARGISKLIGDITPQDKFYQETEEVHTIGEALLAFELELLSGVQGHDAYQLVNSVSTILESMLHEAILQRKRQADKFSSLLQPLPPFYDWTCTGGKDGMRTVLMNQMGIMISHALPFAESESDKHNLFKLMLDISDIILSGLSDYLELVRASPPHQHLELEACLEFENIRKELIDPFLNNKQLAHATTLAEKFRDFPALIRIYGTIGDKKQLSHYMSEYSEYKFSDHLFKWYFDERRTSDLFEFNDTHPLELDTFLKQHPHLYWMNQISHRETREASSQLKTLADEETRFAKKKSTLLSLSKLCLLAADEYDGKQADLEVIDDSLSVLSFQDQIPVEALEKEGYGLYDAPPLSCRDIVELYVNSDKNCQANIYDFLRALELVQIVYQQDVQSEERADLILYVWSMAVMKDDWLSIPTDDPLRQIQDTTVFQIIQRSLVMKSQICDMVLDFDTLSTSPTIQEYGLAGNQNFRFLYSAGYEEYINILSDPSSLDQSVLFGEMNT
ncbi:Nuclear pore complex protein [Oopsacas minuta]|uniref:Nuclear pore complex protein n=1 Tax=Oopsacas minuta TaxID=111878 RepID=A0AAV7JJ72_9METZ|nr:Nuclear pore complex protein [Oopsacas minuta]